MMSSHAIRLALEKGILGFIIVTIDGVNLNPANNKRQILKKKVRDAFS
jgi:hypothetical protein